MNIPERFPVPRFARAIEREWSVELAGYLGCSLEEFTAAPVRHMSFPTQTVRIELMDGSEVQFKYAFAIVNDGLKAIAVFTEHCGHHVFPYHEAKVYRDGQIQFQQAA
jgi:hypothetical protein